MKEINQIDKEYWVIKANALNEARYKLTLQEQRCVMIVASMIKKDDKDFQPYRFSVKDFMETVGVSGHTKYAEIKDVTLGLLKKPLQIKREGGLLQANWFASADYFDKEGYVEITFAPALKPYLIGLQEMYTRYLLKHAVQLRSQYSVRIYELLKQYQNTYKKERVIELEELRLMVGSTVFDGKGKMVEEKFKAYKDFKKKVLDVAQSELPKKTDIAFQYEEIKYGRKVGAIRFIMTVKKSKSDNRKREDKDKDKQVGIDPEIQSLLNLIPAEHRQKKTIADMLSMYHEKHGSDYVRRNIEYSNLEVKDNNKYRAFLDKSLRGDWGLGYIEDVQPSVKIQDGMMVEINGKTYKVNGGGFVLTESGAIPPGDLRRLVLSGKAILKT